MATHILILYDEFSAEILNETIIFLGCQWLSVMGVDYNTRVPLYFVRHGHRCDRKIDEYASDTTLVRLASYTRY